MEGISALCRCTAAQYRLENRLVTRQGFHNADKCFLDASLELFKSFMFFSQIRISASDDRPLADPVTLFPIKILADAGLLSANIYFVLFLNYANSQECAEYIFHLSFSFNDSPPSNDV